MLPLWPLCWAVLDLHYGGRGVNRSAGSPPLPAQLWEGISQHIASVAASLAFHGELKITELVQRESTSQVLGCSLQTVGCFYDVL